LEYTKVAEFKLLKGKNLFLEYEVLSKKAKSHHVEILVTHESLKQVTKITFNFPWNSEEMDGVI